MLRWLTAGESHGPALVAVLDGLPAGVAVTTSDIATALERRRKGYGRGARMAFEQDVVRIVGGVRHGRTMGSPIAIEIANSEWPKWQAVMAPDPVPPGALLMDAGTGDEREIARNRPLTKPRPGHADLTAMRKYGFDDARPALERASARETAARVALGAVARQFLKQAAGIELVSHVVAIGAVSVVPTSAVELVETPMSSAVEPVAVAPLPTPSLASEESASSLSSRLASVTETPASSVVEALSSQELSGLETTGKRGETLTYTRRFPTPADQPYLDADPVHCLDPVASKAMVAEIDAAKRDGDTLGGVVEVIAHGVPPGLGSYSQGDTRLDAQLASALMGIQAVKGVEIGDGFAGVRRRGSIAHDEIARATKPGGAVGQAGGAGGSATEGDVRHTGADVRITRSTNHAGGIEGGMSNGEPIIVRAAIKPISTVPRALQTIDVSTGQATTAHHQRSDTTAVPPAAVVAEAMVALTLARALLDKFGGDSIPELKSNITGYLAGFSEFIR